MSEAAVKYSLELNPQPKNQLHCDELRLLGINQ